MVGRGYNEKYFMKKRKFTGGYRFKNFAGQPSNKLISLGIPSRVVIPLSQGFGATLEPNVKVGDRVSAGQIIAASDERVSSPIHSSVNGKVVEIRRVNYYKREVTMVTIEAEKDQEYKKLEGSSKEWNTLPVKRIEELLYVSGVTSLDREGIPTHFKSSIIPPESVEDLIIHGVGSEPYNISLDVLLSGKGVFNFVEGIKILKKIMPQAKVHIALNSDNKALIESVKKLVSNIDKCYIYSLVPKYPQGYDEVLVPTLLGKKFPYGYSAANIGIVILNIQATLHVYEAVAEGKPLIERTIALCGPSFKENLHLKVRVGTPLDFVLKDRLKDIPSRIVFNSLLTGPKLKDWTLPINRVFSHIIAVPEDTQRKLLAFTAAGLKSDSYSRSFLAGLANSKKLITTNVHGDQRPCVQCNYCLEVCPVRIIPSLLHRYAKVGIDETLMRYGIFNCIDCNLCSYVCPSKIPLANDIKEAKTKLIDAGCDHSLCILPKFNLRGLEAYKGVKSLR